MSQGYHWSTIFWAAIQHNNHKKQKIYNYQNSIQYSLWHQWSSIVWAILYYRVLQWYSISLQAAVISAPVWCLFLAILVTLWNGRLHWGDSARLWQGPTKSRFQQTPSCPVCLPRHSLYRPVWIMEPVCCAWLSQSPVEPQGAWDFLFLLLLPACFVFFQPLQISNAACLCEIKEHNLHIDCNLLILEHSALCYVEKGEKDKSVTVLVFYGELCRLQQCVIPKCISCRGPFL